MLQFIKSIILVKSDVIGISASFACIIHCVATPAMVSLGYFLNFSIFGQWPFLDYVFILLAVIAVSVSVKSTKHRLLKVAFWTVLFIFSLSILVHDYYVAAHYISLGSSIILIFLHVLHWKMTLKEKLNSKSNFKIIKNQQI